MRAEAWEPDADLMRALGLELGELAVADEHGMAGGARRDPAPAGTDPAKSDDRSKPRTSDGRPPWW